MRTKLVGKLMASALVTLGVHATTAVAETIVISVPEMHCAGCANTIREQLLKIPSVDSVRFDTKAKTISAHTAAPGALTDEQIRDAVAKMKYEAKAIERRDDPK